MKANFYIPNQVQALLSGEEAWVYGNLRKHMGNKSFEAWPSIKALAKLCGKARNTVRKYLRSIESKGILAIQERPVSKNGRKHNKTNKYIFVLEKFGRAKDVKIGKSDSVVNAAPVVETKSDIDNAIEILAKEFDSDIMKLSKKAMWKNIKAGFMPGNPEAYLRKICTETKAKLEQATKALESSESDEKTVSNSMMAPKNYSKPKKTAFHNFEQRTSKYSNDDLEAMLKAKQQK